MGGEENEGMKESWEIQRKNHCKVKEDKNKKKEFRNNRFAELKEGNQINKKGRKEKNLEDKETKPEAKGKEIVTLESQGKEEVAEKVGIIIQER